MVRKVVMSHDVIINRSSEEPSRRTYVLDECTLVLECVTLAQVVEFVVEVLVDLAGSTVFD